MVVVVQVVSIRAEASLASLSEPKSALTASPCRQGRVGRKALGNGSVNWKGAASMVAGGAAVLVR